MFDCSVGVRQPYFVNVMQDIFARLVVVLTVALQDFMVAERVFERNERCIGLFLCAAKEYQRFFTDKALVIVHTPNAVMQRFTFADKVSRRAGNDANEGAALIVFERQILFCNHGIIKEQPHS